MTGSVTASSFLMRMSHTFSTSDTQLAAVLLLENGKFTGLDRSKLRVEFLFEDTPALHDVIERYWSNELLCPAQSLLLSFKRAKNILHDYKA